MKTIALCEFTAAPVCLLLGMSVAWPEQIIGMVHFVLAMVAAIVIGIGALRRRPFVPKAAVILAAFLGLPNLMTLSPLVTGLISGTPGALLASYGIMVLLGITQLVAFMFGIQSWQSGQKESGLQV